MITRRRYAKELIKMKLVKDMNINELYLLFIHLRDDTESTISLGKLDSMLKRLTTLLIQKDLIAGKDCIRYRPLYNDFDIIQYNFWKIPENERAEANDRYYHIGNIYEFCDWLGIVIENEF